MKTRKSAKSVRPMNRKSMKGTKGGIIAVRTQKPDGTFLTSDAPSSQPTLQPCI